MLLELFTEVFVVAVEDVGSHVQIQRVLHPPLILDVQTKRREEFLRLTNVRVLFLKRFDLVAEDATDG